MEIAERSTRSMLLRLRIGQQQHWELWLSGRIGSESSPYLNLVAMIKFHRIIKEVEVVVWDEEP